MKILTTFWIQYEKYARFAELNGVLVWNQRFWQHSQNDALLEVKTLGCCNGDFAPPSWVDYWAKSKREGKRRLNQLLPETDVLVINGTYDWLSLIASSASLRDARPATIAVIHNNHEREYYAPLTYFAPIIDIFIAVSPECAQQLAARLPERADDIFVLPCFVPSAFAESSTQKFDKEEIRLIYVGRVSQHQKRVFDLVLLADCLRDLNVKFSLTICGDGGDLSELVSRFEGAGHAETVVFLGAVQPDQVGALLRAHDIFVQVSDFEGTSTSMLEALVNGVVPVVTAASSGIEGIIRPNENGLVVPVSDMRALAGCIGALASSRNRLHEMGTSARACGDQFIWPAYREQFIELAASQMTNRKARTWPKDRPATPKMAPWEKCWNPDRPKEYGRLDRVPMPAGFRNLLRRIIHG